MQEVVALVEKIFVKIANEHSTPQEALPVMATFFTELQMQLMRINHEHLAAFLRRKENPDD